MFPAAEKLLARVGKLGQLVRLLCAVAVFAASVLFLVGQSYNPFIYFRF